MKPWRHPPRAVARLLVFVLAAVAPLRAADPPPAGPTSVDRASAAGYVASADCRSCHEDQFASWHRTFHRTMTQEAGPASVLGDFSRSNSLTFDGITAEMFRDGDRFQMRLRDRQGKSQVLSIDRTVGSRRIQQYFTRDGTRHVRLPVAWDNVHHRWMHLNGSFFHPDGSDYKLHVVEWNANCIFCHNVKAQPGYNWADGTWRSRVAELGIGCGACHGPGRDHVAAAASLATREAWREARPGAPDTRIVHPGRIDSDRSMEICGHCHGQRVPRPEGRIRELLSDGDPYDAGEVLGEFYTPVQRGTTLGHVSFATRFWGDGSPRLSAYEYQGILRSRCFQAGQPGHRITCISCHTPHAGDPRGLITERNRGNTACLQCHPRLAGPEALTRHTGHAATSAGSLCYDCHMPRITYGVMESHRTHDISIPDPAATAATGKPNACNQCHLDRSVRWAQRELDRQHPGRGGIVPDVSGDPFTEPEGARAMAAGDALVRGLTARALGGPEGRRLPAEFRGPLLLLALEDRYPVVRYFAANGLAGMDPARPKPDYLAPEADRLAALRAWAGVFPARAVEAARERSARLLPGRREADIQVGE